MFEFCIHLLLIKNYRFVRGIAAGIYTTNSPEACQYSAEVSKANIIVVEDEHQLKKIMKIRANLPNVKAIIQYSGEPVDESILSVCKNDRLMIKMSCIIFKF